MTVKTPFLLQRRKFIRPCSKNILHAGDGNYKLYFAELVLREVFHAMCGSIYVQTLRAEVKGQKLLVLRCSLARIMRRRRWISIEDYDICGSI